MFSSARERRLWIGVGVVMIAIWSTLGLATTLAGKLSESGLFAGLFMLCFLVWIATIVIHGLRSRPRGAEIVVVAGVVAAYVLVLTRMAIPEERTHLLEYGFVALLVFEALAERKANGRSVPAPALAAIAITAVLGAIDEGIQLLLPSRVFDWRDMAFNALAAALSVGASSLLARVRARLTRR